MVVTVFSLIGTIVFSILGTNYLDNVYKYRENHLPAHADLAWARLWYFWAAMLGGFTLLAFVLNTR